MTDSYTKSVLTVIAVALVILVVQNSLLAASAQRNTGCGNTMNAQQPCTVVWQSALPVRVSQF
jgi:hypothetical protein